MQDQKEMVWLCETTVLLEDVQHAYNLLCTTSPAVCLCIRPSFLLPSSPFLSPSTSTDGIDFRPVNIDLAFNADDTQRCFMLHIIDDHQPEPVERLTLNLFKLGGDKAVIGQQGQLTVQISDDDSESMHWKCVKGHVVRVMCGESVYVCMW